MKKVHPVEFYKPTAHCEKKSRRYPDFRLNLRTVGLELRWYIHPNQTLEVWFILVLIYELLALRGWVFAKIKIAAAVRYEELVSSNE